MQDSLQPAARWAEPCGGLYAWYSAPVLRANDMPNQPAQNPSDDDERLVRAMAAGDRVAFGRLYDRFAPSMLAVAQRIVGSGREAEDLVHDVFLEAWHRASHYDRARGTVRTWLMLRLRSRGLDRLRSARRAPLCELDGERLGERAAEAPSLDSARDAERLRSALAALGAEQRAVLELAYFSGLSCSEIAQKLAIPIGTVKSRMSRAIDELRKRLAIEPTGKG